MNVPCKDCLTYVMCKSRFENKLRQHLYGRNGNALNDKYLVWFAFNDMVRQVKCEVGRVYVSNVFKPIADKDKETQERKQQLVMHEILNVFKLDT